MTYDLKKAVESAIRAVKSNQEKIAQLETLLEEIGYDVQEMRESDGPIVHLEYGDVKTFTQFMKDLDEYNSMKKGGTE